MKNRLFIPAILTCLVGCAAHAGEKSAKEMADYHYAETAKQGERAEMAFTTWLNAATTAWMLRDIDKHGTLPQRWLTARRFFIRPLAFASGALLVGFCGAYVYHSASAEQYAQKAAQEVKKKSWF